MLGLAAAVGFGCHVLRKNDIDTAVGIWISGEHDSERGTLSIGDNQSQSWRVLNHIRALSQKERRTQADLKHASDDKTTLGLHTGCVSGCVLSTAAAVASSKSVTPRPTITTRWNKQHIVILFELWLPRHIEDNRSQLKW
jgi:hypothetical protein